MNRRYFLGTLALGGLASGRTLSATEKKGTVETGAHVSVHYTMDGTNMVATAITASPAKKAAKTPKK